MSKPIYASVVPTTCGNCGAPYKPEIRQTEARGLPAVFVWCSVCGMRTSPETYDPIITSGKHLATEKAVATWNRRDVAKPVLNPKGLRLSHSDALGVIDFLKAGKGDVVIEIFENLIAERKQDITQQLTGAEGV